MSDSTPATRPITPPPLPRGHLAALLTALALFLTWAAATYILEGLPRTLLRPEAARLRLAYAVMVNIVIGVAGSLWLLRRLIETGVLNERMAGFGGTLRTLAGIVAGVVIGAGVFVAQGPPSLDPVVLLNGFSQVLVVSAAEVLVCWVIVGGVLEATLGERNVPLARLWAGGAAAVLFGLYHVAHSPPFNSLRMVLLLSVVGLLTSAFFFISRSVYGTVMLHNFLALFGVIDVLARGGRLGGLERPALPLIATAAAAMLAMAILHRAWLVPAGVRAGTLTSTQ